MKKVWIMRGAAGGGKTFWYKNNVPEVTKVICCDDYQIIDGKYEFNPAMLPKYHNLCLIDYTTALLSGEECIVVDNTNTKMFELAPYYRLAEANGYEVEIIWVIANPEVCKQRNQHGVPGNTIDSMVSGVEPLPPWWKFRVVVN